MAVASELLEAKGPDRTAEGSLHPESWESTASYVITIGNQKGGTGKSTIAIHLAVALMKQDFSVGVLDLDGSQGTLSRYLANREAFAKANDDDLPIPNHRCLKPSAAANRADAQLEERAALTDALEAMFDRDFVVIDTAPGMSFLSQLSLLETDTLITPINDSYLDIDVLAELNTERREVVGPSSYTRLVWQQRHLREKEGQPPFDWIVMRNRLTHIDAQNKRDIADLLVRLAERIGFRLAAGLGERVIFRQMFYQGLTLLDLPEEPVVNHSALSRRAARHELRTLLRAIGIIQQAEAG